MLTKTDRYMNDSDSIKASEVDGESNTNVYIIVRVSILDRDMGYGRN